MPDKLSIIYLASILKLPAIAVGTVSTIVLIVGVSVGFLTLPKTNAASILELKEQTTQCVLNLDAQAHALIRLERSQEQSIQKLNRVLCILGGTPPLQCEEEYP